MRFAVRRTPRPPPVPSRRKACAYILAIDKPLPWRESLRDRRHHGRFGFRNHYRSFLQHTALCLSRSRILDGEKPSQSPASLGTPPAPEYSRVPRGCQMPDGRVLNSRTALQHVVPDGFVALLLLVVAPRYSTLSDGSAEGPEPPDNAQGARTVGSNSRQLSADSGLLEFNRRRNQPAFPIADN